MKKQLLSAIFLFVLTLAYSGLAQAQTIDTTRSSAKKTLKPAKIQDTLHRLSEVVITASRTEESILRSPVSIERVDTSAFKLSAAPSFFDALENIKGVQMITPSLGFRIINTRGFANTTNVRFTQMVDGIDNQAPHIGAPIGNAMGPSDLDIEHVEIIPGTASALYGLNAINGLANFMTKDPFTSEGISIQQKVGLNHVNDQETSAKLFNETSIRIAHKISNRLAFKVNGTFTKGYDWIADDRTDLNAKANTAVGIAGGTANPAYDPVSGYGNESSNRKTVTLDGKQYVVARTGYYEKEVADYHLQNIKADFTLAYKISPKALLTYTYRFADLDNIYQRSNRFRLQDYLLQQHAVTFKNDIFRASAYVTTENTGKSYNLRSAAENEDKAFKSDTQWYSDFTKGFNQSRALGIAVPQALTAARQTADLGRLQPGTAAFQNTLNELSEVNNWDIGSALRVKDQMLHVEGQADLSKLIGPDFKRRTGLDLQAGFDHRSYFIQPDGNYFINPDPAKTGQTFSYSKTGGFIQVGREFWDNKLRLTATLRADRNDYFSTKFNPRFTAVFSPVEEQNIRVSFQSGYRFPSIFEAFSNVNSGGVKRIGGLKILSNGVLENGYLKNSIDAFQAAVTNDFNAGLSTSAAIEKNKGRLVKNSYDYIKPEHINSFEIGYKSLFLDRNLKLDADFYYNKYENFIAQVEMSVPNTTVPDSIPYALNDKAKQSRYRVWTNSQSTVYNYGGSFGLSYRIMRKYTLGGNVTYSKLDRTTNNDGLEDGFNTPEWIYNLSFGGERLYGRLGFNVSYKYQSSYYSQTFLVNGTVKSYGNTDAQVNYDLFSHKLNVKVGGANVFNKYYYSYLGGPSIGGFYYTTFTYSM
ncbi:TonB-dependent receptor [Pedobacter hartonius]|uniref:Iron complex outermembrane recepter protein n=1 Tax=Pedobacter hartonius TaxID=425514 RepID=A0A1H4AZ27_9SPHI|nr:TonB-dependent receptor [Pedobacter hartonius]SEA41130.1 iron complex outermembrane recepter protein [Pedobacter hartonius]